jgi:hypothetical protein
MQHRQTDVAVWSNLATIAASQPRPEVDSPPLQPQAKAFQPETDNSTNSVEERASVINEAQSSDGVVLARGQADEGRAPPNDAEALVRINPGVFAGRRLRGFVAARTRDGRTEVRTHLFDDAVAALAWLTELESLGFHVQTDTEHALDFMRLWPTKRMYLWIKVPGGKSVGRTFDRTAEGYAAMAKCIEGWQGMANIYFVTNDIDESITLGVTKRDGKTITKPREADIACMVAGQVDVDFRTHDDTERDHVGDLFQSHAPRLNVINFTGGGFQGFPVFR